MYLTHWTPRHRANYRSTLFPAQFDDFFTAPNTTRTGSSQNFVPSVDIYEKDEKVFFEAEVPGFKKEDLHVDIHGKIVTISGERKEVEENTGNSYRKERRYGRFERSFRLDFEADNETVEARYEDGILTVAVAKPQEQQKKQIEIH